MPNDLPTTPLMSEDSSASWPIASGVRTSWPETGLPAGARATSPEKGLKETLKKPFRALAAAAVIAAKWGAIIFKLKFVGVLLTMLISIAAYSLFFGWYFALAFVILILIHEYGHVIQLRREGIAATAPRFIPFLGAYIGMKEMPKNALAEARVGLAGPIAGTLAGLVPLFIYLETGSSFAKSLAFVAAFLNFFNLLPVLPLDGGRAFSAISTRVWFITWLAMVALAIYTLQPIIFLIAIIGGFEMLGRRKNPERARYHQVRPRHRLAVAAVYLALVLVTGFGTAELYVPHSQLGKSASQTHTTQPVSQPTNN